MWVCVCVCVFVSALTPVEQAGFGQAVTTMYFCYFYADSLIHLHAEPPPEIVKAGETKDDFSQVALQQIGANIQVIGLHWASQQGGLTAFVKSLARMLLTLPTSLVNIRTYTCSNGGELIEALCIF